MSRSILCKVLSVCYTSTSVCSTSTRESLQGLDYVSLAGAEVFDELEKVVEKLGDDYGKGLTWAKVQKEKLHQAFCLSVTLYCAKCNYVAVCMYVQFSATCKRQDTNDV